MPKIKSELDKAEDRLDDAMNEYHDALGMLAVEVANDSYAEGVDDAIDLVLKVYPAYFEGSQLQTLRRELLGQDQE